MRPAPLSENIYQKKWDLIKFRDFKCGGRVCESFKVNNLLCTGVLGENEDMQSSEQHALLSNMNNKQ